MQIRENGCYIDREYNTIIVFISFLDDNRFCYRLKDDEELTLLRTGYTSVLTRFFEPLYLYQLKERFK